MAASNPDTIAELSQLVLFTSCKVKFVRFKPHLTKNKIYL